MRAWGAGFDAVHLATPRAIAAHGEKARWAHEEEEARDRKQGAVSPSNKGFDNEGNPAGGEGAAVFHVGSMSCAVYTGYVERLFLAVGGVAWAVVGGPWRRSAPPR